MIHQLLFGLGFASALLFPLVASSVSAEVSLHPSIALRAASLPLEWYGEKPPKGCVPADPSTCRQEDRGEGSRREPPQQNPVEFRLQFWTEWGEAR